MLLETLREPLLSPRVPLPPRVLFPPHVPFSPHVALSPHVLLPVMPLPGEDFEGHRRPSAEPLPAASAKPVRNPRTYVSGSSSVSTSM